ncbi:MAG: hypothetical protein V4671_27930 [Armatimonadota bacterium]
MKLTVIIPLEQRQNFAVASVRKPDEPRYEATQIRELEAQVLARQARWLRLHQEPGAWEDAVKRRVIMDARWDYHQAAAEWHSVCRQHP